LKFNLLFLTLVFLLSCGKPDQPISTDYSPYKTESSLLSCKSLKLPKDLKFNGNLLYNIPKCLSNKTESGEETLAGTVSMIEALGIDGLDSLTDLLKSNPEGQKDGKKQYPLIRSFLTVTERGVVEDGVINEKLFAERFGLFQEYSEKLNPYFIATLLVEMAENGRAKDLLDLLFPLIDGIEIKNMMALNRALLVDEKFQSAAITMITSILDNGEIYTPLKQLLTLEESYPLPPKIQQECLTEWLDPVPKGEKGDCLKNIDLSDFKGLETKNASDKYQVLLDELKDERVKKLAKMISQISKGLLTLESSERLDTLKRLSSGGNQALNTQDGFVRNMVALIDFFLGEKGLESKVKISDLDFIMEGLLKSIDQTGPDAVKALNQKVASSKLHYLAEQKILDGGTIASCNGLTLPSLRDMDQSNRVELLKSLSIYFAPYEGCPYGLSPLATSYFERIINKIGINSDCQGPDGNIYSDSCLDREHFKLIAKDLKSHDFKNWQKFENPNPIILKEFVLEVLTEAKNGLLDDPYYLHWPHFAEGKVPVKVVNHIISKVINLGELSIEKIALLDMELENDPAVKEFLRDDFIENLLTKKIDDLKVVADNFSNIFNGDSVANKKAMDIFSGAYFYGPLESFISQGLYPSKMDAEVINFFTDDKFRVEELLGRIRMSGVFINNSLLFTDDLRFNYKFLGEKSRSLEFGFKKDQSGSFVFDKVGFSKDPIQGSDLFDNSYLRFNKLLFEDTLMGVNLKKSKGDEFDYWAKNILFEDVNDYSKWENRFKKHKYEEKIKYKYFETSTYTVDQARKLALFYSKNFLMADYIIPDEGIKFERSRRKRFAPINIKYLSLADPDKENWNYFLKLYPEFLKAEDRIQTYGELNQSIMDWDQSSYSNIPWEKLPSDKRRKREFNLDDFGQLGKEVVRTYNSLNLFTTNRKLKYMPLFGIEKECSLANKKAENCPLTFVNPEKFNDLKQNVSHALLRKLCPYIDSTTSRFSPKFLAFLENGLKIKIIDEGFREVCANTRNNFDELKDNIPYWYHENVLSNLFKLGVNPKLEKGLAHLGASIKFYKTRKKYKSSPEMMVRELINSKGFLPLNYLKYYVRHTRDHRGFLTIFPGAVNTYQNYLFNLSLGFGPQIDDVLARYGAGVKVNEDLREGIVQDFLINDLIKNQMKFPNRDAAAIELIFKILHEIDDNQIDALTGLVAYPQDIESLTSFTGTYSIFLRFLMNQIPPGKFWKQPGSIALKQLMRQENLRALTDIAGKFDIDEINRALKVLQKSIIDIGEPIEAVEILRVVRDFLKEEFLSLHKDKGEGMVYIFEGLIRDVFEKVYFNLSNDDLNKVFDILVKDGLIDFKGEKAKSLMEDFDFLNYFTLKNTHKLLETYQGHFENRPIVKEADKEFFKNLASSLLAPFKMPGAIMGSRILTNLLEDERIGTFEGLLKPLLFEDEYQSKFLNVLNRLNKVVLDDVDKGLVESNILIPSTHHSLKFLRSNMIWRSDASEDVKYGVDSFFRLSSPDSKLWEGNYSLLRNWLTQAKEVK
jgi:hypothetical protein